MADNVFIRKATLKDKRDIVDKIGDVYNGRDYMSAHYEEFLYDENMECFVAEIPSLGAIGFYCAHFFDKGQTLIKRGGRVLSECQGQGIFMLLSNALEEVSRKRGGVIREVMVGTKKIADRISKGFTEKKQFQEIQRMFFYHILLKPAELPKITTEDLQQNRVIPMTNKQLELLFLDEKLWRTFMPNGILFHHSVPYRQYIENMKYIQDYRTQVFMSFENGLVIKEEENRTEFLDKMEVFSIGKHFEIGLGLGYNAEIFYKSDDVDIIPHILFHLKRINEVKGSYESISFYIVPNLTLLPNIESSITKKLDKFGLSFDYRSSNQYEVVFERKFD